MRTTSTHTALRSRAAISAIGLGALIAVVGCTSSNDSSSTTSAESPATSSSASAAPDLARAMDPLPRAFVAAWNNRDAEAMAALFTDDAVLIDADRRFEGRDQIRTGFAEPEVAGYTVQVLEIDERRPDGQRLLVQVDRNSGGNFRATFDFTVASGRITTADLQYA